MKLSILFSLLSTLLMCKQTTDRSGSNMPEKMPEDVRISTNYSAGMIRESSSVEISLKGCSIKIDRRGAICETKFEVSKDDLQQLYDKIRALKFDQIQYEKKEGRVYDRGGTNISISWKDHRINHGNSANKFIAKEWSSNYNEVLKAIHELVKKYTDPLKKEIAIVLDSSLFEENKIVDFNFPLDRVRYNSEKDTIKEGITVRALEGNHSFQIQLFENTQPAYQRKSTSENFIIRINDDTKGLVFFKMDGSLKYKKME